MSNSSPTRFDLSFTESEKPLPPLPSEDGGLEQLAEEICQLDPDFAEIIFSTTFSNQSREEKMEKIDAWASA